MEPVLVVHGGAGDIPDDAVAAHVDGVRAALEAGWTVLRGGGSAIEAVESSVVVMEDDETFDAGRGSFLNRDGRVQLDALLMDGAGLAAGGVGAVESVRNPIRVARLVLERSPQVYLVGNGAERFAAEQGFEPIDNAELQVPRERLRYEATRSTRVRPTPRTSPRSVMTRWVPWHSTPTATSPPGRRLGAPDSSLPDA